ncbi:hypothetical protein [Rhizobium leguminosarum]|uniref:hypothetical protein n=1 Tax=Rhizobium leguminosarum TaxID=384 RepID=UPI0010121C38|nr:hypothetical protein [Rhizobium leguminosarum]
MVEWIAAGGANCLLDEMDRVMSTGITRPEAGVAVEFAVFRLRERNRCSVRAKIEWLRDETDENINRFRAEILSHISLALISRYCGASDKPELRRLTNRRSKKQMAPYLKA